MARAAVGEDSVWPYFFLSYAHPPGSRGPSHRRSGPKKLKEQLYDALCDHLGELCLAVGGSPMGLMDTKIPLGEDWGSWLSHQLAVCRVFVPLLSPGYFASEMCGKEWAAFAKRRTTSRHPDAGGSAPGGAIVPVLWAPMPLEDMPAPARGLQYNTGDFPESYRAMGLYGLMARPRMKRDRKESVYLLAERIRDVAEQTLIEKGDGRDLEEVQSAFGPPRKRAPHLLALPEQPVAPPPGTPRAAEAD